MLAILAYKSLSDSPHGVWWGTSHPLPHSQATCPSFLFFLTHNLILFSSVFVTLSSSTLPLDIPS